MLVRLVGKLLFKASIPLMLVVGVMTWGVYLKGGDPAKLWEHVAGGAFDKAGGMLLRAKSDAAGIAGNLAQNVRNSPFAGSHADQTQVFKWVDADGVTHLSSVEPQGIDARRISVDPNTNVLAPVLAESGPSQAVNEPESQNVEPLPGVAGQLLPSGAAREEGLDATQLIRLLQTNGQ